MKAQKLEEGSSLATRDNNLSPDVGEMRTQRPLEVEALPPNLWNEIGLDVIQYICSRIPFSERYPGNYNDLLS